MCKQALSLIAKHQDRLLAGIGIILLAAVFVPRLWLLETRFFDRDELEHLHTAWLISEGRLLYRDFFQNHTPLLYFLLVPFFNFFDVAVNIEDAMNLPFAARRLMWLLSLSIVLLTYLLGRSWREWRVGLVSAVLLAHMIIFLEKSLEIRPDVIAVSCWVGSLVLLVRGVQTGLTPGRRALWLFGFSGVLLGAAIMATQKMLFAGLGLAVTMLWYLADTRIRGSFRWRIVNFSSYLAGACLPVLPVLAYFAAHGALDDFIYFNLILNVGWEIQFSPLMHIRRLAAQNAIAVGFALAGLLMLLAQMFRRANVAQGDFVIALNGLGLLLGLFIIPVPHRQYFLTFLPLIALYGAIAMVEAIDCLAQRWRRLDCRREIPFFVLNSALGLAAAVTLTGKVPSAGVSPPLLFAALTGSIGIGLAIVHLRYGFVRTALAVLMLAACSFPLKQAYGMFHSLTNEAQLLQIRYVLEHSLPHETVMDGQSGVGVFRPHAYFYWLLDPNIRLILTIAEKHKLLADLQTGQIAPKLLGLDHALKDLSPEINAFFEDHYRPLDVGNLWIRR